MDELLEITHVSPEIERAVAFESQDVYRHDGEYPAWLFFVKDVSAAYGMLTSVPTCNERREFLSQTHDHGNQYMQSHRRLILGSDMGKYTNMLAEINNSIISFLDEKIVPNIDLPESLICGDGMMNARALVDTVCNIIANYRNSKTKTKSLRQQWKDMKALMESMVLSKGIKFAKYLVLSKGIVSPYTYPDKGYELNMDFENLLEEYSRTLGLYKSEKHYITNSRQYALQMLSTVLDVAENHANKPRTGRFFKRWNDLNTDQKQERVKEYLDYLASTNDFRPEWVMEKTSRIKDVGLDQISVKWSQKLGFINSIPGLSLEEETDKFRTKTKKKVKWGDQNTIDQSVSTVSVSRRPRQTVSKKRSSADTGNSIDAYKLTEDDRTRIHRILLHYIIVQVNGRFQSKENAVNHVCRQYARSAVIRARARSYVSRVFDDFCDAIKRVQNDGLLI